MKTIWKYPISSQLGTPNFVSFNLPLHAEFVHVGLDAEEELCVWFLLDPGEAEKKMVTFRIFETGEAIDTHYTHLGSFVHKPFVWHLFLCA